MRNFAVGLVAVVALTGCVSDDERMGHTVCDDDPTLPDCPQGQDPGDDTASEEVAGATGDVSSVDCGGTADADFPTVVGATVMTVADGRATVSATLCSAYDTPERYADAWRVLTPDGDVLGVRELLHDHAGEQPFTRRLTSPIEIPDGLDTVVVEGRDLVNGWGGGTVEVPVP